MSQLTPVFGIDLGTTFSAIAYVDGHGKAVVIPNQEGRLTTASVVHFAEDKETVLVGEQAVQTLIADSDHTVSFIKRRMGLEGFQVNIYGQEYTPQQISAFILEKLKKDAEAYFTQQGQEVTVKDVVITVPAYFGMAQKGATKEAGEIAGFNVLHIINEPTAAALAFAVNSLGRDKTVFVFDLGGGTFDVTILETKGEGVDMVASDGDPMLGGKDWDDLLTRYCSRLFREKYGKDPQGDSSEYQELYDRILKGKIFLSTKSKTEILVSCAGKREKVEITREQFEGLCQDRLAQCRAMSERVLTKAKKVWNDIDLILLVGGSTYMPMIRSLAKEMSGKEPSREINPDQCVAVGAALQAHLLRGKKKVEDTRKEKGEAEAKRIEKELLGHLAKVRVTESVAKPIGIIVLREGKEVVKEMIPEQSKIPFKIDGRFAYQEDGQTSALVEVTEGEGSVRADVRIIGELLLEDLPPRPEGAPIDVIYHYTADKILEVEAIDVETGKRGKGKVILHGSMTEEEKLAAQVHHHKMKME